MVVNRHAVALLRAELVWNQDDPKKFLMRIFSAGPVDHAANPYLEPAGLHEKEALPNLCGIAAVLYRSLEDSQEKPVGFQLREMLQAMRHRGTDSTGVTIAGEHFDSDYVMRLFIPDQRADQETVVGEIRKSVADNGGEVRSLAIATPSIG